MVEAVSADADAVSPSLVNRVMSDLTRHIRENGLEPGAVLPSELAFAARSGVSRAVAREAYRGLAALKLIDIGNGRKARVAATDESVISLLIDHSIQTKQTTFQQILDVRRTIELRTAALSALRRTDAEADSIVTMARDMKDSFGDPPKVMALDIAFHETIARSSRNPFFAVLMASFRVVTEATWAFGWRSRPSDESRMESVEGHMLIANAIHQRDPSAAERAMADHFDLTIKALISAGVT